MKFFRIFAVSAFCIALPGFAHAMSFTEIYYDPIGTDTGHEFIEIYNDESESVDLTGWKLFEANSNHGLTAYAGDLILESGEYAVIADQPAQLAADFSGIETLLDSVFSLNNTGEALALKNQSGSVIDEVTYISSQGGSQDGGSLNKVSSSWVSRTPSPGTSAAASSPAEDDSDNTADDQSSDDAGSGDLDSDTAHESDDAEDPSQQSVSDSTTKTDDDAKTIDPKYTLTLKTESVISANDPTTFEGILKRNDLTLLKGIFQWSLGDGTTFQRNKILAFDYTYQTAGTYVVVLEYYRTSFDTEPFLQVTKKISVIEGNVEIESVDVQGAIVLANNDSKDIDLEDWRLVANGKQFVFGKNTFVLAGDTLSIASSVHRLAVGSGSAVILQNPSRLVAAQYPKPRSYISESVINETSSAQSDVSRIAGNDLQANVAGARQFNGMWPWLLGLLGILIVVGVGLIFILRQHHLNEKKLVVDEQPIDTANFSSDDIELLM